MPTGVVRNPHDVDAQWSAKGEKRWVGYKVQVAETIAQDPEPVGRFITSVVTQKATESDDARLELKLDAQAAQGLQKPAELYVDGAYISGAHLQSAIEQNYELVGPAQPSAGRANIPEAYRIEAFTIDIAGRQAICPGGFYNTQCSRLEETANHRVKYRFEWSTHCHSCALITQCVGSEQRHRTIVVGENHDLLQARRIEQKSEAFKERMHQRNGIEGTIIPLSPKRTQDRLKSLLYRVWLTPDSLRTHGPPSGARVPSAAPDLNLGPMRLAATAFLCG
jgi:transposase